jgi:hypothetical protein
LAKKISKLAGPGILPKQACRINSDSRAGDSLICGWMPPASTEAHENPLEIGAIRFCRGGAGPHHPVGAFELAGAPAADPFKSGGVDAVYILKTESGHSQENQA